MDRIISLVIGYLFGNIQAAILYGKIKGIDITQHGSGNPGTTNTVRVLGKKAGAVVLVIDVLKVVAAAIIARLLFPEHSLLVSVYGGLGAIIGHSYPLFFKLKGGKGIAATVGTLLAVDYRLFFIGILIFLVCFGITRIVSISSLVLTASIPVLLIIFYCDKPYGIEAMVLGFMITAITFYRHKANIKRLIEGTETKLTSKK